MCQVTQIWFTDQNSGRPPFFVKKGKRTQHDKQRDGQMVMRDELGEHTPHDCSPSSGSIVIGVCIVNTHHVFAVNFAAKGGDDDC
jgi:hypothetical protein